MRIADGEFDARVSAVAASRLHDHALAGVEAQNAAVLPHQVRDRAYVVARAASHVENSVAQAKPQQLVSAALVCLRRLHGGDGVEVLDERVRILTLVDVRERGPLCQISHVARAYPL